MKQWGIILTLLRLAFVRSVSLVNEKKSKFKSNFKMHLLPGPLKLGANFFICENRGNAGRPSWFVRHG